jgi:hypothetical protein
MLGRDSSVGIATRYGVDGPGIKSRWGRYFPYSPERPLGPASLLYNVYRVFPGGKAAGAWHWPLTPSSAEVKERVKVKKLKADLSGLYDTDARRHIVSLPLTELTPSSPENAAYQAGMSALC